MKTYIHIDQFGAYYYKDLEKIILHREDGPAVEWANGRKFYYYQDEYFPDIKTDEQWEKLIKRMRYFGKIS